MQSDLYLVNMIRSDPTSRGGLTSLEYIYTQVLVAGAPPACVPTEGTTMRLRSVVACLLAGMPATVPLDNGTELKCAPPHLSAGPSTTAAPDQRYD